MATSKTFLIREESLAEVQATILKAASKLGCDFNLQVGNKVVIAQRRVFSTAEEAFQKFYPTPVVVRPVVWVTVDVPSAPGYTLLAKLTRMENRNLVTKIGDIAISNELTTTQLECKHCNSNRARLSTYLIRKDESGELLQIGTACINEYFNNNKVAKAIEKIQEIVESHCFYYNAETDEYGLDDHDELSGGGAPKYMETLLLATLASATIRLKGFVSGAKAVEQGRTSTKDQMLACIYDSKNNPWPIFNDYDKNLAKGAIQWGKTLDPKNDFEQNVKTVCSTSYFSLKFLGFLAAAVNSYKTMSEARESTSHLGEIGGKITANVEVIGIYRHYVNMMDDQGHKLSWRANFKSMEKLGITQGWKGTIKALVKGHSEFRGAKQTDIGGVKIA